MADKENLPTREFVRRQYAAAARGLAASQSQTGTHDEDSSCCGKAGESCCGSSNYNTQDLIEIGLSAEQSLACGNAVAAADLKKGERVLDLGSGAGLDVFLSAKRVGPAGRVYGLEMTDEMLALARGNQQKTGLTNVEFLKGCIEQIPLAEANVDVVVSNCVINLSTDKPEVFKEIFRVLRPGGRIAIADIVAEQDLGDDQRKDLAAWAACLAGALTEQEYRRGLLKAGFGDVDITSSHQVQPGFFSMIFRARKPLPASQPEAAVH